MFYHLFTTKTLIKHVGVLYPGTAGHQLEPDNLDTIGAHKTLISCANISNKYMK
jgi:hypothetical protein